MSIVLRSVKEAALTHAELDNNFIELRDGVGMMVPKTKGEGIRIGPYGSASMGWHDLMGALQVYGEPGDADRLPYRGGIKALEFHEGDSAYIDFHIPHDYYPNSTIYIHAHWSHTSTLVTGGSVTWGFEIMYAKGHNQEAFHEPVIVSVNQAASTIQYQHLVAEGPASVPGGSSVALNTDNIETDGIIQCRIFLDSNDITVSSGLKPNPYLHTVDIHYQSTNMATKQRAPDFWA